MVSNSSTFDQDLDWAGSELHKLGQLTGVGPQDVIPGVPATAAEVGEHLSKLGSALERAGQGIKSIDSGGWTGQAGDAFRANFLDKAPAEWLKAADALTDAGQAVRDYEQVLATEKPRAQRAKEELDQANEASRAALAKHNATVAGGSGTGPGEFVDPGAEARARAQQEIAAAKAAVQAAGDRAADVVLKACQGAPDKPGPLAQIAANIADGAQVLGAVAYDFGSGVVEGVVGMAEGALGLGIGLGKAFYYSQPGMQFTDPEGYRQFNEAAATTVQSVVENPWQAVKTVVDVDGWKENPAKALGSMVPDAAAGLTGAGLASRVLRSTDHITDAADTASDISRTTDRVSELGRPDGTPPWADLDSAPPPRAPEAPANPWDGHEFGPKGSDPLPDPEPPQAPVPEPRNRHELPDWFDDDNTPDSWLESDSPRGADPTPDPAAGDAFFPEDLPYAPAPPRARLSPEDLAWREAVEEEHRAFEASAERQDPAALHKIRERGAGMSREWRQ